jgi:hypothetical protein
MKNTSDWKVRISIDSWHEKDKCYVHFNEFETKFSYLGKANIYTLYRQALKVITLHVFKLIEKSEKVAF